MRSLPANLLKSGISLIALPSLSVLALWCAPALAADQAPTADPNHCVACHENEILPISLGHSFPEWKGSSHARAGVTCDDCHGGDPTKRDAQAAHEGVFAAAEPRSLVHEDRLAATCGGCHKAELAAFRSTVHGKPHKPGDSRATCMTCHGSMATSLPSPAELRTRCAVCHDKQVEAQSALAVLANAKIQLYRTRRTLESVAVDEAWKADALQRFHDMEKRFHEVQLEWHTFRLKGVLHDSMNVLHLAKLLDEEAKLRAEMEKSSKDAKTHAPSTN